MKASFEDRSMIGSFFDIFTLYFEIFTNKTIGQFSGQENDHEEAEEELRESEETSANDWITNNCFNLLEIDSLLAGLMGFVPKLLKLDEKEAELDTFEISLAQKYLSFLINYIYLKQTYLNEPINDVATATTDGLQDADQVDLTINKSSILFSFVQIFARFMGHATAFARLISYFLRFVEAYLSSNSDDNSRSLVKFDRDLVYLWLLLSRKWLLTAKEDKAALVEYLFICLNNLLDTRQLNGLLFKMKQISTDFSEIFIFVCLKCYQTLSSRGDRPAEAVKSFLVDYLFSSSVITHTQGTLTSPSSLFKSYLDNAENGDENLVEKLGEKLNIVKSLYKKKQTVRLENEAEFVIEVYSQAFIYCFQETIRLGAEGGNSGEMSRQVLGLNLSLRTRHLLYLVGLLFHKVIWEIIKAPKFSHLKET
jgi:hypothetical protein